MNQLPKGSKFKWLELKLVPSVRLNPRLVVVG